MAYELKPGNGTLFENNRKQSDTHPDLTGSINVNGVEHWFSGWWKQGSSGAQFLSVSIGKPKDQQSAPQQRPAQRPAAPAARPGQRAAPARRPAPASFDDGDGSDVPF